MPLVLIVVSLLLGGVGGYVIHGDSSAGRKAFTGKITVINGPGNSGCVQPDHGGNQICGGLYHDPDLKLSVGNAVTAVKVALPVSGGATSNELVVYVP